MSIKGKGFDLLGGIENAQTPLYLSLFGFRKSLSKHLGLKALPLVMHDNAKAALRRDEKPEYPYGYFKITGFEIVKDQTLNKAVRRHGSTLTLDELTNATVTKGYLFPANLTLELHFIHNDAREVLQLIEKVAILGAVDGFSFRADMPGASDWQVGVALDDGPVSIPDAELESETDAGAFDITLNFKMSTKVGVVKAVPKINNEGRVTQSVGIKGGGTESIG